MKLVTAEQMRGLDSAAINTWGVSSLTLMENAGRRTVEAMLARYGEPEGRTVAIFAGPGNNGGDGLVIARLLSARMAQPVVFLLVAAKKLKGDAAVNFTRLHEFPVRVIEVASAAELDEAAAIVAESWAVVDGIFGTGLTREVSGTFAAAVDTINAASCPVVALDIVSGINADSGRVLGLCVEADLTVSFGAAKIGQAVYPGRRYTGELEIVDIGIPPEALADMDSRLELLDRKVGDWLKPRSPLSHKGTYGHLLVLAGSTGKTGAAMLCGLGALRAGTGLVSLGVPHDLNQIFETGLWEAMTIPLHATVRGILSIEAYPVILDSLSGKQALVIGPGIGTAGETAELVKKLYREVGLPLLVDADGLNILATDTGLLQKPAGPRILTPHPGEMARLLGVTPVEIAADRLGAAREFAERHQVYVVLKGADTLVVDPAGNAAVNPTGNPGMACGGMGDVLAGLIGGFLAQGMPPWPACCLAVFSHGLAADLLAAESGAGYLASEVAREIPFVLEELKNV